MTQQLHDAVIIGAGITGTAAACLLARAGFSVALLESRETVAWQAGSPVGLRVSAISPGAQRVLAEAGAWRMIMENRHCAYREMRVEDRDVKSILEFNCGEFGLDRLGSIVENDLLQWSLWQCARIQPNIELRCPATPRAVNRSADSWIVHLRDGGSLRGRLLIGADGADSYVRSTLGVGLKTWDYGQQGIVAVVRTERPNRGLAWQRFLPGGPLAFLPLADGSSSIVWSCPVTEARQLMTLGDGEFRAALNSACATASGQAGSAQTPFGAVAECGVRAAFPLLMQLTDDYAADRAILLGDAAHVVHPLAGQGLNLGLIDAAALAETLIEARQEGKDFAANRILRRYARWRRSEAEMMARGIHVIRGLFTPDSLAPLRRLGLGLVNESWMVKEAFMHRAIGRNRAAPALARGVALTDLLQRQS